MPHLVEIACSNPDCDEVFLGEDGRGKRKQCPKCSNSKKGTSIMLPEIERRKVIRLDFKTKVNLANSMRRDQEKLKDGHWNWDEAITHYSKEFPGKPITKSIIYNIGSDLGIQIKMRRDLKPTGRAGNTQISIALCRAVLDINEIVARMAHDLETPTNGVRGLEEIKSYIDAAIQSSQSTNGQTDSTDDE